MIDCHDFDEAVGELAFETLGAAERDAMLAHAAGCDRCRQELQIMSETADRLLLLAPEAEPPMGFEQRALQAVGRRHRSRPLLLAAAAALVLFVGGVVLGRHVTDDAPTTRSSAGVVRGVLVDSAGGEHGSVSLTTDHGVVLTMSLRALDEGLYHCVVHRRDGTTTEVAAWPVGPSGAGVWAVGVSGTVQDIRSVSVTEDDGTVVATASLD
jgi:hypothetical protein